MSSSVYSTTNSNGGNHLSPKCDGRPHPRGASNVLDDRWLSVDEIIQYLGVSSDTVYRWIDKHDMPAHRMGRLWKFKKDEVDEWVKGGGQEQDE